MTTVERDANQVTLYVGGERFDTLKSTLQEKSLFFAGKYGKIWGGDAADASDPLRLDLDPDVFKHVLEYLRSGLYPLLWDMKTGFDHNMYAKILAQAHFLGIEDLQSWIRERKFLGVIRMADEFGFVRKLDPDVKPSPVGVGSMKPRQYFQPMEVKKKPVYQCPRGIEDHHGFPARCDSPCEEAKSLNWGGRNKYKEEPVYDCFFVQTTVNIDYAEFSPHFGPSQ